MLDAMTQSSSFDSNIKAFIIWRRPIDAGGQKEDWGRPEKTHSEWKIQKGERTCQSQRHKNLHPPKKIKDKKKKKKYGKK